MKNGNAAKIIGTAITILLVLVGYIFGGWRTDMANAQRNQTTVSETVQEQGNRITALETRYESIDKSLAGIERMLAEKNSPGG